MIYSEAAYFDGNHCAHVAAWEERRRLDGINRRARAAWVALERRKGSRRATDLEVTSN
jgi:hypothetical protein